MPSPQSGLLTIGSIVQGGYEILAELGTGSFGRVYKARQISTGQAVAVKILRYWKEESSGETGNQLERFQREMRLCAQLSHPNIVRLIDSGEAEDGTLYTVFEFVPGTTLKEVLASERSLRWNETLHLMTQVLDALACAHALGVVHRDLKPENIMVTKTGARRNALVLDFGLGGFSREAQQWSLPRLTATHEVMGTPCYAAPEQLRGEPPSVRSDLYSWGLIFLECLTGELAVAGGSTHEVLLKQLGPEPLPIPASIGNRRLRKLLQAVTVKQVEKRDVTIEGLLQALGALEPQEQHSWRAARSPERTAGGERRQLTIVSCGLALASADGTPLDVEELDELLHAEHAVFEQLAARGGGHVGGVLGDRILFVFGYPHAREDDARRAARVGLQIVAEAERAHTRLAAERGLRLEIRIGIHTGLVIVHELRQGLNDEPPDMVGPTPQVATRLQELARPGEILASLDTQRLLRDTIRAEPMGEYRLAELSHALAVFRLTSEQQPHGALDTIPLVHETPLVGRRPQLDQLLAVWERTSAGRGAAVLVTGEPGIGKSRLVRELRRAVPSDAWLEVRCLPENQDTPLRPIADMLLRLGESAESLLARHGFDVAEDLPPLAAALSLPAGEYPPPSQLSPDRQKELALNTILRLVFKMAEERSLALALEDLHWADPTTLEVIASLIREAGTGELAEAEPGPAILVVATARPEFTAPWPPGDVRLVQLARLARDEVETMVRAGLASDRSLPPNVLEEVIRRADGVPLFVEEVTRVLIESHALPVEADALATQSFTLEIPGTLRDLLVARLDGLSPSARETAQLAAVLGREFRAETLRAASPREESALREDLRELTDAGIVYYRRSVRSESYVFKHALVRDAAYETLIRSVRQELHRRVGNVLRQRFSDIERNRPEILAQHFERGAEFETAVEYWKRAGDRTMARGAYVESIRLFECGLALLRHLPESRTRTMHELRLTESLGTAFFLTRGYGGPGVEEKFTHALNLCDELGEGAPLRVLTGVWVIHIVRGDRSGTGKLLDHIRRTAEGSNDPVTRMMLHGWSGVRAFYAGEFIQARDEMTQATEWYHTQGFRSFVEGYGYDGGIDAFAFLTWTHWVLGQPDRALEVSRKMLSIAEETANPSALTTALAFSANLARDRGEPERVLELAQRSITLANEQKLYFWLGPAMCTAGWAAVQQGDVEGGIAQIQGGLAVYESVGVRVTYAYHLSGLIEAHLRRKAAQEGLALVDGVLPQCQTLLDCFYESSSIG